MESSIMEYKKKKKTSIRMMSEITSYLKQHHLYFKTDQVDGTPRITMVFQNCDRCPDNITEGCIWFYEDSMEVRVYYSKSGAEICKKSTKVYELCRLLNFMNARIWIAVSDGMEGALYKSQCLILPRFYITEDEMQDITSTMLMPHPKGDDFTQPKPITHQAAWALLHERPDICEKNIWNQITSE